MNKSMLALLIVISALIGSFSSADAFDNKTTHRLTTNRVVTESNLNDYLKYNLGFTNGYNEIINGKEIIIRLADGSEYEDDDNADGFSLLPQCRAVNHFHNPLLSWDQSYMTDQPLFVDVWCWAWKPIYSNITWATSYLSPPLGGTKVPFTYSSSSSPYTWDRARDYYYKALTLTTKIVREIYFAWTFQTVGHVIHLLEDMAVPAHTRNDFQSHYIRNNNSFFDRIQPFENYVKNNPFLVATANPTITDFPSFTSPRLTDYWDTNLYNGSNPSTLNNIGLAEFTNANYFSDSTIWNNIPSAEHTFSFPKVSNSEHQICTGLAPDGSEYRRYISRLINGACPPIQQADNVDHFATPSLLNDEFAIVHNDISTLKLWLDDNVHNTYAKELLPRTIGYSAALLNYFFRGQINLVESGTRYKIENLADESMEGTINSFQLFYDDFSDNRQEIQLSFYDEFGVEITDPATILSISAQSLSTFEIQLQNPPADPKNIILVFRGKLGNEDDAVVGKVIDKHIYFVVLPVDHVTRETLGKRYYYRNGNVLVQMNESDLPFGLVDDGGYWDASSSNWTANPDPESLKVPLSVGGPQYIAKYRDEANNRVRFVPNLSYEKEAYQAYHRIYRNATSQVLKDLYYVTFIGNPIVNFGAYEENAGYMEYMEDPNNPGHFGVYTLRPVPAASPLERFFSSYRTLNFVDRFIEFDAARFYEFDGITVDARAVPKDMDAPFPSVTAVSNAGGVMQVIIPSIYDNYIRPTAYWEGSTVGMGSSGADTYTAGIGSAMSYAASNSKCVTEDKNCGNLYDEFPPPGSSNMSSFDIPYNYNSRVHVVADRIGGQYYEELYINGQMIETSPVATDKPETHYQILAVYKNIALIRETRFITYSEVPLNYWNANTLSRIHEGRWDYEAHYYIYVNGVRYDLPGVTTVRSKYVASPDNPIPQIYPEVYYLTYEQTDDISGYHPDRIFISDTFNGDYVMVAFDEYSYNSGAGFVHTLRYEESDTADGTTFLFYDIPQNSLQNADHEATRTGRQWLLFKSDGTLVESLQDPVGLNYTIGSIGILN